MWIKGKKDRGNSTIIIIIKIIITIIIIKIITIIIIKIIITIIILIIITRIKAISNNNSNNKIQ